MLLNASVCYDVINEWTTYFSSSSNILAQRGERRNVSVNEESFASIAFFFRSGSLNEDDNGRDEE